MRVSAHHSALRMIGMGNSLGPKFLEAPIFLPNRTNSVAMITCSASYIFLR